jgi:hypothetical protein
MTESVANAVFLRSRAGKEDELADRLEALVLASRSDPGVMIYDLHRSTPQQIRPCGSSTSATNRKNISTDIGRIQYSAVSLRTPRHS